MRNRTRIDKAPMEQWKYTLLIIIQIILLGFLLLHVFGALMFLLLSANMMASGDGFGFAPFFLGFVAMSLPAIGFLLILNLIVFLGFIKPERALRKREKLKSVDSNLY